jgi:hypothetical protein
MLVENPDKLTGALERVLRAPRIINLEKGMTASTDASMERRLLSLIKMVSATRSVTMRRLIPPFIDTLIAHWDVERVHIDDAVSIINEIRRRDWSTADISDTTEGLLLHRIVEDARQGCNSNDLRELAALVSNDSSEDYFESRLHDAYENYVADYFINELRECKSESDFEGLIDELELIGDYIKANVSIQVTKVRAEAEEYQEHRDSYEDNMHDEWKDQWRHQRSDESSVRNMFGSLKREEE